MIARKRKKAPRARLVVKTPVRFRVHAIISEKVEQGVRYGYSRAHKHTNTPNAEAFTEAIEQAVMDALSEVIDFEPEFDE